MGNEDLDFESDLIDLSNIDLTVLPAALGSALVPDSPLAPDSPLVQAIRRILRAAEDPEEAVSAFQQSI
jgi:FXSXX-COOH protein